jgi:hypothetical protein
MPATTDCSYPHDMAERKLGVQPGTLTLDQLAESVSRLEADDPVSVRDVTARPIRQSAVYYRGERQPQRPHLMPATEYAVKVLRPGRKRWEFLEPTGSCCNLRVHAARFKTLAGADNQAEYVMANNDDVKAKVVTL